MAEEQAEIQNASSASPETKSKKQELSVFLVLTVIMAPILSVAIVGGYGFFVWIMQILMGPPSA